MGITCSCLQVVLWWVGCVRSMPIDAALRLVLPPLSFALLCAYSVLVYYALVHTNGNRTQGGFLNHTGEDTRFV